MDNARNIPKPEISPDFTIEDIHKIREYNYERRKGMTVQEAIEDTRKGAERAKKRMAELKAQKTKETTS